MGGHEKTQLECFIKGKLLRYFRHSALVTYFSALPSASISMLCILSLCQTPKGEAAKTSFATPPHYALFVFVFFERNGAVEDEMFGSGIGVDVVVSRASELQIGQRRKYLGKLLNEGLLIHADAVGIEEGAHSFDATNAVFIFVLLDGIARIFARP